MPRARKTTGVAKRVTRTKRARRTRRSTEDTLEEAGMGGSVSKVFLHPDGCSGSSWTEHFTVAVPAVLYHATV
ncbi:hypothetical protein C0J45_20926 [Silurus meridionalis]|nr:hypothetical protein C0J45_20926 [Silurus meridionalis]